MDSLIKKVAKSCNISEQQAELEISTEMENLSEENDFSLSRISETAYTLGLDMDDILSNPGALFGFM